MSGINKMRAVCRPALYADHDKVWREPITEPRPDPKTRLPMMCSTGSRSHKQWPYYLSLYDEPISFGTEMYLS